MEVCSSTSVQSRGLAIPTHWQNKCCARQRRDLRNRGAHLLQRNLILASRWSGFTKPVRCTYTHSRSMVLAPMASTIFVVSPVQCSPMVVGRYNTSGRYCASNELLVKSAPKPPLAKITGPNSLKVAPPFSFDAPCANSSAHDQLRDTCVRYDPRIVGFFDNLLHHLSHGISDGHSGETLPTSVGSGSRVATKTSDEGQD